MKHEPTGVLIEVVLKFWEIVSSNVHGEKITYVSQLDWLITFANAMQHSDLSINTKKGLVRTCVGLQNLGRRLLQLQS